ncbi:MAG: ribosome-associated translation inhibitor RaiA [Candidatus Paceibacterota bacterium]|jgi:ribosomal subunit interface protein
MKTNIKAVSIKMTPTIVDYIESKISHLDKLVSGYEDALVEVEIGKLTNHHKNGEIMFAEINLKMDGKLFRQTIKDDDLYAAIDLSKDKIEREIVSYLKKKNRLLRRGGRAVKNFIRDFYWGRREKGLPS